VAALGRTIINTVLQVIVNTIDHKINIAKAIESFRIHHQSLPVCTRFEDWGISPDTKWIYEEMGTKFMRVATRGQAMGIYIDWENNLIMELRIPVVMIENLKGFNSIL
jgi:gamma-glutamyltranspeptidase/glutathione hydrolase